MTRTRPQVSTLTKPKLDDVTPNSTYFTRTDSATSTQPQTTTKNETIAKTLSFPTPSTNRNKKNAEETTSPTKLGGSTSTKATVSPKPGIKSNESPKSKSPASDNKRISLSKPPLTKQPQNTKQPDFTPQSNNGNSLNDSNYSLNTSLNATSLGVSSPDVKQQEQPQIQQLHQKQSHDDPNISQQNISQQSENTKLLSDIDILLQDQVQASASFQSDEIANNSGGKAEKNAKNVNPTQFEELLYDFKFSIHQQIQNLHLEVLHQFEQQKVKPTFFFFQHRFLLTNQNKKKMKLDFIEILRKLNYFELVKEVIELRQENEKLRSFLVPKQQT